MTETADGPALCGALAGLSREARFEPVLRAVHIAGIGSLDDAAYGVLLSYQSEAAAAGYPVLC